MGSVLKLTKQDTRLWAFLSYHAPSVISHKTLYEFLRKVPYPANKTAKDCIRAQIKQLRETVPNIETMVQDIT